VGRKVEPNKDLVNNATLASNFFVAATLWVALACLSTLVRRAGTFHSSLFAAPPSPAHSCCGGQGAKAFGGTSYELKLYRAQASGRPQA